MSRRCKTSAICIIVRANTTVTHESYLYVDNISEAFLQKVKNINIEAFFEQFQGFAIQGIKGIVKLNTGDRKRLDKKAQLRVIVCDELSELSEHIVQRLV